MQGRAPEIGGVVRQMVEPVAQFPVTAVTDPLRAANQAQQVLDPAYAMARGLTTTRLGAEARNPAEMAAGVTEMGLAGLSFIPGGAAVKGARAMPPARLPEIPQPRSASMQAAAPAVQSTSRGPILDQLAGQPELLGGGLGGALGATQGETPQERARNALLGAAGGAIGGRLARGAAIDRTRTGSNLGNVPKPVQKAQAQGYQGADVGEAKEWVSASSKGLDMSQPARMQRAQKLGFDTGTPLYHGTGFNVDAFDISKGGTLTGAPSARKAIWLTDNPDAADLYAVRQMDDVLQEGGFYRPDLYERYKKQEITYSQMEEIMRAESVPEKPRLALRDLNDAIEKATDKRTARIFEQETGRDVARLSRARNPAKEAAEFFDSNAAEFGFEPTPATNEIKQKFVNLVEATRTAFNYNQKYNFTKSFQGEHQFSPNEFEGAPKIIPVYARLRNPMIVDQENNVYREQSFNDLVNEAIKSGHDGLVIRNTYDPVAMNAVAIFDPSNIRSVNAAFDPASKESANILATPPELGGAFVGGALGGTQGETPEERARNALLGAAGGAIGGRLASRAAIDRTRTGSNLGNISQAAPESEWVRAQKKGLDLSEEGRLARARAMGADVTQWEAALTQRNAKLAEADQLHTETQRAITDSYYETLEKGAEIIEAEYEAAVKAATDAAEAEYQAAEDAAIAAYEEALWASEDDVAEEAAERVYDNAIENAEALRDQMISKAEEKADAAKEKALERLDARATKQQEVEDEELNDWLDHRNDDIEEEYNDMILDLEVILPNGQRRAAYNAAFDPDEMSSSNILAGVGAVGAGAAMMPREARAQTVGSDRRPDGTKKGLGYFGEIPITFPNGDTGVATEYSTQSQAVKVDGKMIDFPTLVPTLTPDEVRMMATDIIPNRKPIPETIMQKAIAHARKRLAAGQSVYADEKKPLGQRPRG